MDKDEIIKILTKIEGIGKARAESIYNSGFDSIEKIREAKVEDLSKIKGISEDLANKIKEGLKEASGEIKEETKEVDREIKEKEEEKAEEKRETKKKVVKKKIPKIKPKLDENLQDALKKRKEKKTREPEFIRQEWFRYKKLGRSWRRPKGLHSKLRKGLKYRPARVKIGYRSPKLARHLHPSGFEEVLIFRSDDLEKIDPERQAVRVGGSVGTRKRIEIVKKADELGIKVLNRGEL